MEIEKQQYIEIVSTLEQLERVNVAINFHKKLSRPDVLAIQQYERLKADYFQQLAQLLAQYEIEIRQPELVETC